MNSHQENATVAYIFRMKDSPDTVVFYPESDDQRKLTLRLLDKWKKRDIWIPGIEYAEDFGKRYHVRYKIIEKK